MDAQQVRQIISSVLEKNRELTDFGDSIAIFPVGSVLRGGFIPGWSDVDVWILADTPSAEYLRLVGEFGDDLKQRLENTKVGVEVFCYSRLLLLKTQPSLARYYYKVLKNLSEGDEAFRTGSLFMGKQTKLPVYSLDFIRKVDPTEYVLGIERAMTALLSDGERRTARKYVARKLVKNILFLIQVFLIHKKRAILHDSAKVLFLYRTLNHNQVSVLNEIFSKRNKWYKLNDDDIKEKDIHELWKEFLAVEKEVFDLC